MYNMLNPFPQELRHAMLSHNIIHFFVYFGFHPIDGFFRTNKFIFDRDFSAIYKQSHIKPNLLDETQPYKTLYSLICQSPHS